MQNQELRLGLVALQVELHHPAQLLERLVDVAHAQALPSVVGHPPLLFSLGFLLGCQVLVVVIAGRQKGTPHFLMVRAASRVKKIFNSILTKTGLQISQTPYKIQIFAAPLPANLGKIQSP